MYNNLGVQRYRETDINSMSSEKMIVLLYEKIVSDLRAARRASEEENGLEMTKKVNHSQRIVSELRSALDHSIGGEISQNLDSLYTYLFHEHLEIFIDRDPQHIDNCLKVITPLLEAWRQIPSGTGEKAAQDQARQAAHGNNGPDSASHPDESQPGPRQQADNVLEGTLKKTNLLSVSA